MKHWMPTDGWAGGDFIEEWCCQCQHDENEECETLTASYFEAHLDEWRVGPDGPYCTRFKRVTG